MKEKEILKQVLDENVANKQQIKENAIYQAKAKIISDKLAKEKNPRRFSPKKLITSAVLGVCVLALAIGVFTSPALSPTTAYASTILNFDINPSIEIGANDKDIVVYAKGLNDDGKKVLSNINLENKDVNVAVKELFVALDNNGYIQSNKENAVTVAILNENQAKTQQIQDDITKALPPDYSPVQVNFDFIVAYENTCSKVRWIADTYNVSPAMACKMDIAHDKAELSYEDGAKMSYADLRELVEKLP
ncbi:MAG: hypothetical protein RRZ69_04865, partial [Clostridia bacterium]